MDKSASHTIANLSRSFIGIETVVLNYYELSQKTRNQIYQSRKEIFIDKKQWSIDSYNDGDIEFDEYDDGESYYICAFHNSNVTGCVRLRPSTAPTLMTGPFKWLKEPVEFRENNSKTIWEASRFFITPDRLHHFKNKRFDRRTHALFLCMIEFGMKFNLSSYEVVVDAMMIRILRMSGWPLKVLNSDIVSKNEKIYYGLLPCNSASFCNINNIARTNI